MADFGLFIGFGAPVRGRERQTIQGFSEVFGYNSRLQQEGEIESFETVLLEPLTVAPANRGRPSRPSCVRPDFVLTETRACAVSPGARVTWPLASGPRPAAGARRWRRRRLVGGRLGGRARAGRRSPPRARARCRCRGRGGTRC